MRRRTRWIAWGVGGFVAILSLAVVVIAWVAGQGLLHPKREQRPETPTQVGLTWSYANFTTSDGVGLVGWWVPADETPADNGSVLFLHGYTDSKNQSLNVAPFLHRAGYNVLTFDFRAQGYSGGGYATAGILEVRDVQAAVEWLRLALNVSDPKLALFGWSMGGATAISAAPSVPGVDAVIADGSFSRLQNIVDTSIVHFIKNQIGFAVPRWPIGPLSVQFAAWSVGLELDANPPVEAIQKFRGPVLLFQGTADNRVYPNNGDELAAAGGANVTLLKVEGAGHVACLATDPDGYETAVLEFLGAAFSA